MRYVFQHILTLSVIVAQTVQSNDFILCVLKRIFDFGKSLQMLHSHSQGHSEHLFIFLYYNSQGHSEQKSIGIFAYYGNDFIILEK